MDCRLERQKKKKTKNCLRQRNSIRWLTLDACIRGIYRASAPPFTLSLLVTLRRKCTIDNCCLMRFTHETEQTGILFCFFIQLFIENESICFKHRSGYIKSENCCFTSDVSSTLMLYRIIDRKTYEKICLCTGHCISNSTWYSIVQYRICFPTVRSLLQVSTNISPHHNDMIPRNTFIFRLNVMFMYRFMSIMWILDELEIDIDWHEKKHDIFFTMNVNIWTYWRNSSV